MQALWCLDAGGHALRPVRNVVPLMLVLALGAAVVLGELIVLLVTLTLALPPIIALAVGLTAYGLAAALVGWRTGGTIPRKPPRP